MLATENLRRQHRQIAQLGSQLEALLKTFGNEQAPQARNLVSSLAGVLNVHLAMEDGVVYPKLAGSTDARVRELATQYAAEMGTLRSNFDAFVRRWRLVEAIAADGARFSRDARELLGALNRRISREDNELYPLVDTTA